MDYILGEHCSWELAQSISVSVGVDTSTINHCMFTENPDTRDVDRSMVKFSLLFSDDDRRKSY